jgi:hypothetical protein
MPTYGTIFTKEQADQDYGPALESIPIPAEAFRLLLNQTSNHIMFRIENGNLFVLDNNRNLIYPQTDANIQPTDECIVYSLSVIDELLESSGIPGINVNIERRSSVLSVTYGDKTMETGAMCPPNCPSE